MLLHISVVETPAKFEQWMIPKTTAPNKKGENKYFLLLLKLTP